jgi:hypothetical protein
MVFVSRVKTVFVILFWSSWAAATGAPLSLADRWPAPTSTTRAASIASFGQP